MGKGEKKEMGAEIRNGRQGEALPGGHLHSAMGGGEGLGISMGGEQRQDCEYMESTERMSTYLQEFMKVAG